MNEEQDSSMVEREESDAEQGSEELPDPDREGPDPESENPGETTDEGRNPPPDDLTQDPAYSPEGPEKGIKGG